MINALISNPSFQLSAAVWKANMQKNKTEMGRRLVWMIEEQKERRDRQSMGQKKLYLCVL